MKILVTALAIFLTLTAFTGVLYPSLVTVIAQVLFKDKASGSLLSKGDLVLGSSLIGQQFSSPAYFWPRPSASGYNAIPSSASNLGPTSEALKMEVADRKEALAPYIKGDIPADMVTASGSGLDPHISPSAAYAQVDHVVSARNLTSDQALQLAQLISQNIESPQLGIFGAPRVNVLKLNLAVDKAFGPPDLKE